MTVSYTHLDPLAEALRGHHGLLLTKENGGMMSQAAFERKYQSYITFLERKLNGYPRCQYGRTRAHKALLAEGKPLPPFREIDIRCHDFRVTFCTTCYNAGIPPKTTQIWMGHADTKLVMDVYTLSLIHIWFINREAWLCGKKRKGGNLL